MATPLVDHKITLLAEVKVNKVKDLYARWLMEVAIDSIPSELQKACLADHYLYEMNNVRHLGNEYGYCYYLLKKLPGIGGYWADDFNRAMNITGLKRGYSPGSLLDRYLDHLPLLIKSEHQSAERPPSRQAIRRLREWWYEQMPGGAIPAHSQQSFHEWFADQRKPG